MATPVRLADLMPTLLDLGGLPIPESLDGRSLLAGPRVEPVLAGLRMDGIELLTARRAEYMLVWDVANDEGRLYAPGAPGAEVAPIDPASRPGAERAEQQLRDCSRQRSQRAKRKSRPRPASCRPRFRSHCAPWDTSSSRWTTATRLPRALSRRCPSPQPDCGSSQPLASKPLALPAAACRACSARIHSSRSSTALAISELSRFRSSSFSYPQRLKGGPRGVWGGQAPGGFGWADSYT